MGLLVAVFWVFVTIAVIWALCLVSAIYHGRERLDADGNPIASFYEPI
jgi:hypothetical protein